jgi:hypothetical protein
MALDTKPAWVLELKKKLEQPYTPEEMERIRQSVRTIERLNAGKRWPRGTFQHLLDMAKAEDDQDESDGG